MQTKVCKQCGDTKPIDHFRPYYAGRKGRYTTCRSCERINTREKYLSTKQSLKELSDKETAELEKIHLMWEYQRKLGLQPPKTNTQQRPPVEESLDDMVDRFKRQTQSIAIQDNAVPPFELQQWLVEPLTKEPEHYQEEVYYSLRKKFLPVVGINVDNSAPIYDTTFLEILQRIAARFDEYEDKYYGKDD